MNDILSKLIGVLIIFLDYLLSLTRHLPVNDGLHRRYQTIVSPLRGNCLQATVATILNLRLNEVPSFHEHIVPGEWAEHFYEFMTENGYPDMVSLNPKGLPMQVLLDALHFDGGINGFWLATVPSATFKGGTHSVIIDSNAQIVHDPNPNQKAMGYTYADILEIDTVKDNWYIDQHHQFQLHQLQDLEDTFKPFRG